MKVSRAVVYLLIGDGILEGWMAEHSIVGCNDDVFDFTDEKSYQHCSSRLYHQHRMGFEYPRFQWSKPGMAHSRPRDSVTME